MDGHVCELSVRETHLRSESTCYYLRTICLQAPHKHIPAGAPHGAGPDQASASNAHARPEHACSAQRAVKEAA